MNRRKRPITRKVVKRIHPDDYWIKKKQGKTYYYLMNSDRNFSSYKHNIEEKFNLE